MRFSLRALLAVTCVAAAASCLCFVVPDIVAIAVISVLAILPPAALTAGIIYGRQYVRAFSIGGLTSCIWVPFCYFLEVFMFIQNGTGELDQFFAQADDKALVIKILLLVEYVFVLAAGATAVTVRWLCVRAGKKSSSKSHQSTSLSDLPPAIAIEPRDKAELYTILQGRVASPGEEKISLSLDGRGPG